jgi:hypothetical protein
MLVEAVVVPALLAVIVLLLALAPVVLDIPGL